MDTSSSLLYARLQASRYPAHQPQRLSDSVSPSLMWEDLVHIRSQLRCPPQAPVPTTAVRLVGVVPGRCLPDMMVMGWIFWLTSFSASRSSSPASTTTEVVPSPTSASCVFDISAQFKSPQYAAPVTAPLSAPALHPYKAYWIAEHGWGLPAHEVELASFTFSGMRCARRRGLSHLQAPWLLDCPHRAI